MAETDAYVSWRKLREFRGVDLTKSFVLSWHFESRTLMVDVDLYLEAEHPFYEKPRPAEKVCIRAAIIDFPYCESVTVDGATSTQDIAAALSSLEVGAIEGLRRCNEGPYEIRGAFGTVRIDSERPILRLRGA